MGAMFDAAFRRFASAFEHRADQVYGTRLGVAPGRRTTADPVPLSA